MSFGLSEDELVTIIGAQFSLVKDDKLKALNDGMDLEAKNEITELMKVTATKADIYMSGFINSALFVAMARAIIANNKEIAKLIQPSQD